MFLSCTIRVAMKTKSQPTRRVVYSTLTQLVHYIPRWSIQKLANKYNVDARSFSETSHVIMLMLAHLMHAYCLTEVCDNASIYKSKLKLARGATPGARNTFSHANRTRSSKIGEELYWLLVRHLSGLSPKFVPDKKLTGFLSRFKSRGVYAIDSTTIKLALTCIGAFPFRQKKAAAKMHTRLPVGGFIPSVVRIESGKPHDAKMADALTKDMICGDILLADRAYVDFSFLHGLTAREVFWVLRQKVNMEYHILQSRTVEGDIISDDDVILANAPTQKKYPEKFRRIRAIVEVNGEKREMTFLTNNFKWAAKTICELYKARWAIEIFFKEMKQTLQLADFIGTNENAVEWQIWSGLIVHLLLHYLKFLSKWGLQFSRLVGIVRSALWMECDIVEMLKEYGTAPPPKRLQTKYEQMELIGFEGQSQKTVGQHKTKRRRLRAPRDRKVAPAS